MALTLPEQFYKILYASQSVIIILPENVDGDELCAGYALAHYLHNRNIECILVTSDCHETQKSYTFLPTPRHVRSDLKHARDFLLVFKTTYNDITNVRTTRTDDKLTIHVTPEKGSIDARDFSFELSDFPFDALLTLGLSSREDAGSVFRETPDIFYDVPIINIDRSSDNEEFGHINMIIRTASSLSEVIADLLLKESKQNVTSDVAQCLLTGIISGTDSFRKSQTTPRALSLASDLIKQGADQQEVVTHMYRSQPLSLLQLWGRALTSLTASGPGNAVMTLTLDEDDFKETNSEPHLLPTIVAKAQQNNTKARIWMIFYTFNDEKRLFAKTVRTKALPVEYFGPEKNDLYNTIVPADISREKIIAEAERILLDDH